jgi:hypothetical protein
MNHAKDTQQKQTVMGDRKNKNVFPVGQSGMIRQQLIGNHRDGNNAADQSAIRMATTPPVG